MGKSLRTCNFRLFVLFKHRYIIIPYYHKAINQNLSNVPRLTGIAVIKGMHTISPRQPHMVIYRGVRWCTTAGYPAAPSLDLKHFAERWELKDPLLLHPFWLLNEKCAIWAMFRLPIHTGVFVNANWPAKRPLKWNAASQTHYALFVIQ